MLSRQFIRKFSSTAIRRGAHGDPGGYPGGNLPFDISNRYKLTLLATVFFSSGFSMPFLITRHQLLKD